MKQQLVIALPGAELHAAAEVFWCVFNGGAELQAHGLCALAGLQDALAGVFEGGETVVLVPGELVLLTAVRIPSRQLRQIKQALPYMVEELIADNIEDVHLALPTAKIGDGEDMPVAIVGHHLLIDWLDQLYQHGVRPDFLGPDSLATPWRENSRAFFVRGDRIIYRDGPFSAQVLFRAQLPAFLQLLRQQGVGLEIGALPRYTLYSGSDAGTDVQALAAEIQAALGSEIAVTEYSESAAEVAAATALRQRGELINLLQGGYSVQRSEENNSWWRRFAAIAAIGLVAYGTVSAASGIWFSWRAGQVQEQTVTLYRELFPQERRVLSPKKQMTAHLRGQGALNVTSPLPLLEKTALGLRGSEGVRLDQLQYRQQSHDLQVQLRTSSLEALDQVKQALGGVGLGVEINSAVQQDGATLGRINIRETSS